MDERDIQPVGSDICEICGLTASMLALEGKTMALKGWLNIPVGDDGEKLSIPVYVCSGCDQDYTLHFAGAVGIDYDGGPITFREMK